MRIILSFLFAAGLFLMPPAQAASLTVCNPAGQSEDGVYVDTILASSSGTAVDFSRADTETIEAAGDGLEAFNALFLARGWGDGLPLVPPTPERVKAMLAGYDLPDDFPIATLPPLDGVATVGKIAVNAVMAGCEPRHMPLLVAAVEAVSQPESIRDYLVKNTVLPYKFYTKATCVPPEAFGPYDANTLIPRFTQRESIKMIVSGGPGKQSQFWVPFPQVLKPVSAKIAE